MIDERQKRLMEVSRSPVLRLEEAPRGAGWRHGAGEIRSCGDRITVHLRVENDRVAEARYQGVGCALALASAELLCTALAGRPRVEARRVVSRWQSYLAGEDDRDVAGSEAMLEPLSVVRSYPARKSCVLLAFDCAREALASAPDPAGTEAGGADNESGAIDDPSDGADDDSGAGGGSGDGADGDGAVSPPSSD